MTKKTVSYSNLRLLSILGLICVLLVSLMVVGACGDDEEKAEYTLTIAVSPSVGGTTSPAVGTHTYDEGASVTITATAATGYDFDKWSGASTATSATTTVTMTSNKTVTANFEVETPAVTEYTLTMAVDPADSGTTTPAVGTHTKDEGTVATITATAATGYQFDDWTGDVADATAASTTVTMDANQAVTANFSLITYTLTMTALANVTTTPVAGTYTYDPGEVVDISAVPAAGWSASWTDDVAADATSVTMDGDKTVTPVLTAATSWVYDVTYGTTVTEEWTVTIVDDDATVDTTACYVTNTYYDPAPDRMVPSDPDPLAVVVSRSTTWKSKATLDNIEAIAGITLYGTVGLLTYMTYTYTGTHGAPYTEGGTWTAVEGGVLDPPLEPPYSTTYTVTVGALTNVTVPAGTYECYPITYTVEGTTITGKMEYWCDDIGGMVKIVNYVTYVATETQELAAYIPAGAYVP